MSLTDFFSQGGYAFFVWSSYGMALLLMLLELTQLRRRHRTILARLGRLMRIQAQRGTQ
ncbi:MAG: heme exporter protein CcmD [Pseudomonadota bacterium]|nr:heme exporter protein CcmD [Pseudomonadota bacterium]